MAASPVFTTAVCLLLCTLSICRALEVYHCDERMNRYSERYLIPYDPCVLRCCGSGRTTRHLDASFFTGGKPVAEVDGSFATHTCTFETNGDFICSIKSSQHCKNRDYRCTVREGGVTASANITTNQPPKEGESETLCEPPLITNIVVLKIPGNKVLVGWNYTKHASKPFCSGTRRFRAKMKSYETYEQAANDERRLTSEDYGYTDVAGRRVTNITFENVRPDKFYRFLVRARTSPEASPEDHYTDPEFTLVQHFGPFSRLTWSKKCLRSVYHVLEGDSVVISCDVTATPPPSVTYQKKGSNHVLATVALSAATLGDNGTYAVTACHQVFHNNLGSFVTDCVTINIDLIVIPTRRGRVCSSYTGTHCSEFIHGDLKVFFGNDSNNIEETILGLAPVLKRFSPQCHIFVKSALCHVKMPYCNPFTVDEGNFSPLPMCPKTCSALMKICGDEIEQYGQIFSGLLAERCKPELDTGGPGDLPGCMYIDPELPLKGGRETDAVPNDIASLECTLGNGQKYRGRVKKTSAGLSCQSWNKQAPRRHQFTKMMVGELEGAGRYCRNPGGLGEGPWCFVADPNSEQRWGYCDVPVCEQCVPYSGEFCRPVGYTSSTSVLLRRQLAEAVSDMELKLRGTLHTVLEELTPACEMLARQLLCSGALPTCENGNKLVVCESQCNLLDILLVCSAELKTAIDSSDHIDFSVCRNRSLILPSSHPSCLPTPTSLLSSDKSNETTDETDCLHDSNLGQTYSGEVNVTEKGERCVPWATTPVARVLGETSSELNGSFCRNPGRLGQRPWCFTSVSGDWDYCNVTLCSAMSRDGLESGQKRDESGVTAGTTLGVVFLVAILVLVSVVLVFWQWSKIEQTTRDKMDTRQNLVQVPQYIENHGLTPKLIQMTQSFRKIQKCKIRYLQEIGQGHFGTVFQGECDWIKRNNSSEEEIGETVKVAVKTHKGKEGSNAAIEEFVREAMILHQFNHPNIVEFYGVCMDELPFYMVFEYMDQGDLCQHLRERSSSAQRRYNPPVLTRSRNSSSSSNISNDSATLGATDLLDLCKQIACGMAYLESEKYIHRDLAARNCLVASGSGGPVVKIADFGMSKNLYSKDYYKMSSREASLPIRWMSPEALIYGKFSTKADVWAFGVVMWEVFNFGLQPYWGHSNEAVMDMVRRGKLLEKPDNCPDKLFSLVKGGCWGVYEHERMSFKILEQQLRNFRLSDSNSSLSSVETESDNVFDDNRLDDDDATD